MIHARIVRRFPERRNSTAFLLDVDIQTAAGVTVLFGPSGAGKTLTLDSLAGFVRPDEGRILIDDQIVFDAEARVHVPPRERRCGYVFQNYALFPHMTLRENLAFGAERLPRLDRSRKIAELLERFHLAEVAGRRPHELSGGQKQRCSIARALVGAPRLLLLDEPARGLDAALRSELYAVLRQVRAGFGTPIVLVTHSLEECFELGDEMFVLHNGRIVQSGVPGQVAGQPANVEVARLLGVFNIFPAEIRALDPSRNASVLRYNGFDFAGTYYPGHLIGDRVHVCVAPPQLHALPREGKPAHNQMPAQLLRAVEMPQCVRLEFAGDLAVEMPRPEWDRARHAKEWVVEFPPGALRVL